MSLSDYSRFFTREYMMGPNTLRLLDEAMRLHPLIRGGRILDLGCGTGLSSLYLAREADASVFAVDLWISATDNHERFLEWNAADSIIPIHADANDLPFADGYFDAVVSVDAYHYFAGNPHYFPEKLLPLVRKGGSVLIVIPGLREEFNKTVPQEILDWAGDEHTLFHSCEWWKETIGCVPGVASADFWELGCTEEAWQEWFASGHKYALSDKAAFDRGVGKYLTFVGIAVRKEC